MLYAAVTILEPYACAGIIQHYVALCNGLALPLLRIYVDLERLTKEGQLVRHIKPHLGGTGTTWFWEPPGLVLAEPDRMPPKFLAAEASMRHGSRLTGPVMITAILPTSWHIWPVLRFQLLAIPLPFDPRGENITGLGAMTDDALTGPPSVEVSAQ